MAEVLIRRAEKGDGESFFNLIRALALYEGSESGVLTTLDQVRRFGFGKDALFNAFLADVDGVSVGFVSFTVSNSIWYGKACLNVDDVYVNGSFRGMGIGALLMNAIARECIENHYAFARWTVENSNHSAIGFYRKLGAMVKVKGVFLATRGHVSSNGNQRRSRKCHITIH